MKKRLLSTLLALCLVLALLPGTAWAADSPAASSNINSQNYTDWPSSTINSYLYANERGGVTRVEYVPATEEWGYHNGEWNFEQTTEKHIVVEEYSSDFVFQSGQSIPMELDIWGGFFAGETYNFLVFGQENMEENNSKEVIRVVKYSKDWQRLDQASLYGANTVDPFDFGTLRAAEYGGVLYIRTCHRMYKSNDGANHQANMTIAVREQDMTVTDSAHAVEGYGSGYVSHCFSQFILADQQKRLIALDHGDVYPRGLQLALFSAEAGSENVTGGNATTVTIQNFAENSVMYQRTGASVGGMAETTTSYVVTYNYDGKGSSDTSADRSVYFAYVDKNSLSVKTRAISGAGTTTPVLAPTGLGGGYILWNASDTNGDATDTLYYATYSDNGAVGTITTATAPLSDCQPIFFNGKVVWYVTGGPSPNWYTKNSTVPTFYLLDENGVTAVKTQPDSSGTCGDGLTWALDGSEYDTLTIQGTGPMDDYDMTPAPWSDFCEGVHTVTVDDGVTTIGNHAFDGCVNLTSVTIPNSITRIEPGAFENCSSLSDIYYGGGESQWMQIKTEHGNDPLLGATIHYEKGDSGVSVTVNGKTVTWTDAAPFIDKNSRTMVPLRAVGDALGLTVNWDGNAREAIFTNGVKTIYFPIGSNTARTSSSQSVQMDTAAVIVNKRTYAPIRYLAEYFGYTVGWDSSTKTVLIF